MGSSARRRRILLVLALGALVAGGAVSDALAQPGIPASARERIRALEAASPAQRARALEQLLADRSEALVAFRGALAAGAAGERRLAAEALGETRDRASLDLLIGATSDPDPLVRRQAVLSLRKIGDPAALPRIRALVVPDQERGLLKVALVGLGELGTSQDQARMRPYLRHGDETVRVTAAGALAMLGSDEGLDVLLAGTSSDDAVAIKNATYALGFLRDPAARSRLEEILDDSSAPWRSQATMALARQDLAGADEAERAARLGALARGRDRQLATWALTELLRSSDAEASGEARRLASGRGRAARAAQRRLALVGGR
jgi:HEAT repeat protein